MKLATLSAASLMFCLVLSTTCQSAPPPSASSVKEPFHKTEATLPAHDKAKLIAYFPGGCHKAGDVITITGNRFGAGKGKSLVLAKADNYINLKTRAWSDSRIVAVIPTVSLLTDGVYRLGLIQDNHAAWISNTNVSVKICGSQAPNSIETQPDIPPTDHSDKNKTQKDPSTSSEGGLENPDVEFRSRMNNGTLIGSSTPDSPELTGLDETEYNDVEPSEVIVISRTMEEARALDQEIRQSGITVKRRETMGNLGFVLSTLRIPEDQPLAKVIDHLQQRFPDSTVDANQQYSLLAGPAEGRKDAMELIGWPVVDNKCGENIRIGLIDTGIDLAHPAIKGQKVTIESMLSSGNAAAPPEHGTAIADILIGSVTLGQYGGLLPGSSLYAAAVFRTREEEKSDTTAELVVRALNWLLGQQVSVVNMSLGGRRNRLMEYAIKAVIDHDVYVVAAAGNSRESDTPVYPAALPGVIAVTAVDSRGERYRHASSGDYISFSAPGVDIWVAAPGGGGAYRTGTSYAAPFVAAAIALTLNQEPSMQPVHELKDRATDLGRTGKDSEYGWGLLKVPISCDAP